MRRIIFYKMVLFFIYTFDKKRVGHNPMSKSLFFQNYSHSSTGLSTGEIRLCTFCGQYLRKYRDSFILSNGYDCGTLVNSVFIHIYVNRCMLEIKRWTNDMIKRWIVENDVDNKESYPQIVDAARILQQNEVVAFPTETVYGLGANAKSDEAVDKIFKAKGRPSDNPLIVHISNKNQLKELVEEVPEAAEKLMTAYWPGPLTLIFQKKDGVLSEKVTAGLDSVGIRMPDHPVALAIIEEAGLPIAAPSANRSGKPSPTTAQHVIEDLEGRIIGVVDGGETGVGVESTVVDCTGAIPVILRPGGVTKEQLEEVVGEVSVDPSLKEGKGAPKSPGMKYTHYAPDAPVWLVDGTREDVQKLVDEKRSEGLKAGVLTTDEFAGDYRADVVFSVGRRDDLNTVAHGLYDKLRAFNNSDVDIIFAEMFPEEGVGLAIMNRLQKAAGYRVIKP